MENELDRVFSLLVRQRYADWKGSVRCYTCSWVGDWREAQCGHFIKRANEAVRWDDDNARPQCPSCNMFADGKADVFEEELRDELGEEGFNALLQRSLNEYPDESLKSQRLVEIRRALREIA